jgi:hypothetical protein
MRKNRFAAFGGGAVIGTFVSLSLAISLPTMLVGFSRYSTDQSFALVGRNRDFVWVMAVGSLFGAFLGDSWSAWFRLPYCCRCWP